MNKFDFERIPIETMIAVNGKKDLMIAADKNLRSKGTPMNGWVEYPSIITEQLISKIEDIADWITYNCEVFLNVGVGGSSLGAKAVISALTPYFSDRKPEICYCGDSFSAEYIKSLIEKKLKGKSLVINVISKSGTTKETIAAFEILMQLMRTMYSKEDLTKRIIVTTDSNSPLKSMADSEGYQFLEIPSDIGGRYSVLTPVGLLPAAVAGINIEEFIEGAKAAKTKYSKSLSEGVNDCYQYAAIRYILETKYRRAIEIFSFSEEKFKPFGAWLGQLFCESLGKEGKGIFTGTAIYTADAHSIEQMLQQGTRNLFETNLNFINSEDEDIQIPNSLTMNQLKNCALTGILQAHQMANIPVINGTFDISAFNIGYLIYFFMLACAINGFMLGIDPLNQPGVELYKAITDENIKRILQ